MQNQRRHKRFRLDLMEVNGKMTLAHKVEIIDISMGGVALKTDKRLNIGNEYMIKLGSKGRSIDVKGVVIRCELSGIEQRSDGEGVSVYTAGMMFKNIAAHSIAEFVRLIEQGKKNGSLAAEDRRGNVRFFISPLGEQTLSFPAQFTVKLISLGGMLILTDHALEIESRIPMGLSLEENGKTINFTGRVASCLAAGDSVRSRFEIGVEFMDLTDENRAMITTFTEYLSSLEGNKDAKEKSG